MDSAKTLSIGFLRSHREGAAAVLGSVPAADAAAYLKDVPDDAGGRALEIMQPLAAAAILSKLAPERAAAMLLEMDVHGRSRIVRVLDDGVMRAILDQMPKGAARDLARFLKYPDGSVGAWMSSDVAIFEKSVTVGDCLEQLRALPDKIRNLIFVIDAERKLVGTLDLADLLAMPDDTVIDTVTDRGVKRLSPYARLTSVAALAAWETALSLPVVDAKGRVLGALHFERLREGVTSEQRVGADAHMGHIMAHVAEAFLICAVGILHGPSAKSAISRPIGELED